MVIWRRMQYHEKINAWISILIKHESCLCVCLFMFFSATKSPSFMKFWFKASFGPGWNITNFSFLWILWAFFVFLKSFFFVFFLYVDYSNTKKLHTKKFRKISVFRCFSNTQIQKWCVCSRFPQPSNIRAAWNLEFK